MSEIVSKASPPASNLRPKGSPVAGPWLTPPWTMEERLRRIQAMGERLNGLVEFICNIGSWQGTCAADKERAVIAFYDRMVRAERELGKVQEDLQLG